MIVSELMHSKVNKVHFDDRLITVKSIFENSKIHYAVVVEENKIFGVVSDRDLYMALSPNIGALTETSKDTATLHKRVHQIATRNPVVLELNAPIVAAIGIFSELPISSIPIVNDEMTPLGILTARDVFKTILSLMRREPK
ncbi:CBS domain-containing protein [Nitrosomonas ureae]|uniref:Acetoin utilization protein AcuB n=1 Tax=Nitrosomonas ureae TaxID=44577 RepID=A0A1H9GRW0_9PROT|nr:CBS domain-containing protein [Nitrosomonas ureae]SEQ52815.1 acetoin utilization protein AcuB [Nitrosomonas ureae]